MKTFLLMIIFAFSSLFGYCQTAEEHKKTWDTEIVRICSRMVEDVDLGLKDTYALRKTLSSKNYKSGNLSIYKTGEIIKKITKTYSIDNIDYTENYYFSGNWPIMVIIENNISKASDKFYFDKTNLMLWITEKNEWLHVGEKNCSDRWFELLENMERLKTISKMSMTSINEDEVQLPKEKPLSKADSLELIKLRNEVTKLLQQNPDTSRK